MFVCRFGHNHNLSLMENKHLVHIPAFVAVSVWMITAFTATPAYSFEEVLAWFLFFYYLGWLAVAMHFIRPTSALVSSILGAMIVAVYAWNITPLLWFFVSSSLLSKLPQKNHLNENQNSSKRNGWQILANGGTLWVIGIFSTLAQWPSAFQETMYLSSVAIACADTWASEIGSRFNHKTFDIVGFAAVPKGLSGGISVMGTLATIAGAASIALFAPSLKTALIVAVTGIAGSLLDSILGSQLQAKYLNQNGNPTDFPTDQLTNGYKWVNNDWVNFLSNAFTIALLALMLLLAGWG